MAAVGFGLVTRSNAPFFVPSNASIAPLGPDKVFEHVLRYPIAADIHSSVNSPGSQRTYGVPDQDRVDAYE
jgi:hypothetical protein